MNCNINLLSQMNLEDVYKINKGLIYYHCATSGSEREEEAAGMAGAASALAEGLGEEGSGGRQGGEGDGDARPMRLPPAGQAKAGCRRRLWGRLPGEWRLEGDQSWRGRANSEKRLESDSGLGSPDWQGGKGRHLRLPA